MTDLTSVPGSAPLTLQQPPLLVNSTEASRLLCISPRSLWTRVAKGEIATVRWGRSVRFDMRDLLAAIDAKKTRRGQA